MASLGDQVAELGEARLGNKLVGVTGAAKEPEEAMKLGDGPPAGVFDRTQCLGRLSRLAIHHPSRCGRLYADHAHVVSHDIVQFAGDPDPFREHCLTGVLLALGLEFDGLIGQLALTISQRPYGCTEKPGQGEHEHVVEEAEETREQRPVHSFE